MIGNLNIRNTGLLSPAFPKCLDECRTLKMDAACMTEVHGHAITSEIPETLLYGYDDITIIESKYYK